MTQAPFADALADLVAPLAASMGLELWGIEQGFCGRRLVRVFVESDKGVTIEQCAELSRLLGLTLDVADFVPDSYVLEVSSPGLERRFFTESQLAGAVGRKIEITLHQARADWPGRKKFSGTLRKAPDITLPGRGDSQAPFENANADGMVQAPDSAIRDDRFLLQAEDLARPGDAPPLIAFAFADLKKVVQVHCFEQATLPGKGKKKTGGISHEPGA